MNDRDGIVDGVLVAKVRAKPPFRRWEKILLAGLLSDKRSQGVEKQSLVTVEKLTSNFGGCNGRFRVVQREV